LIYLNLTAAYGISRVAYRKVQNWPVSQAESGFDLIHVEPGKILSLTFRHWRWDSSVWSTFLTLFRPYSLPRNDRFMALPYIAFPP